MQAGKALFAGNQLTPIVLAQFDGRTLIRLIGDRHDTITQCNCIADFFVGKVGVELARFPSARRGSIMKRKYCTLSLSGDAANFFGVTAPITRLSC